jgi:AraC-like DNA-binding protein
MRDTLTDILLGLRLDGVEYGRCLLSSPWAVAFPATGTARFHFVAQGSCWLQTDSAEWIRLNPGDAILFPRGSFHVLASSPEVPMVDINSLARRKVTDNIYLVNGCATVTNTEAQPAPDAMFCGAMRFNLDPLHPLIAMMPDLMRASDLARRDPSVPVLLEAMEREVRLDRIGACGISARLADVLAASIIRAWVECACSDAAASGWIAAVRCPKIGKVLAAIHNQPEKEWNLAELAGIMGASRSSFADKFTRTLGESPARYVARIKMFQARQWISRDGMRVAAAANRLGYDSEASFSRAFKRIIGHAPGELRGKTLVNG